MQLVIRIVISAIMFLSLAAPSEATPESQAAVLFLLIEPGARASALGDAYVSIADDATASYFNPAGLAGQTKRDMTFTHTKWLPGLADDLFFEFVGYSQPIEGWGNVGVNLSFLTLGTQERRDEFNNDLGTFSSYDFALSLAYGAFVTKESSAGLTLKIIRSNLADVGTGKERGEGVGTTFATDLGYLRRSEDGINFGVALRNLGPKISFVDASQADPLPQHIVVGASYKIINTEFNDIMLTADFYKPLITRDSNFLVALVKAWGDESFKNERGEIDIHLGGEYQYFLDPNQNSFFALRAGYTYDKDGEIKTPTFGVGLKYDWVRFDFAYISGGSKDSPLQDSTKFSVNLNF